MGLDGFSLYASVYELNKLLVGGRVDKICQPRKADIYISVRLPGKTYILHLCTDPRMAFAAIAAEQPENPPEPPTFCMLLRKQLEGGRIAGVSQLGLDRVMVFEIDTLGAGALIITKKLYVELMGKYSNVILVQDGIVIDSLRRVGVNSSRVRTILPQQTYLPPPPQESIDVLLTAEEDFISRVREQSDKNIYKAVLQLGAGFGPVTVGELLFLAGLPADISVSKLNDDDFSSLTGALQEIISLYKEKQFMPLFIQNDGNKVVAMAAFPLHNYQQQVKKFPTMSMMLEAAYVLIDDYVSPEKEQLRKVAVNELNRQKNKREKLIKELQAAQNAQEQKNKADNIMTYQYQFEDHMDDMIAVPDIYDENGALLKIAMDKKLTVIQNMQKYYNKYDKLRRAEKILKEQLACCSDDIEYLITIELSLESSSALSEIADIRAELVKNGYIQEEKRKRMAIPLSTPFKFILSDGTEVLAGKNNFQNDRLTLKTAQPDDIWLHTKNIPGSHVIMRTAGRLPEQQSIEEAAMLAAYYSKARNSSKVPVDYTMCRYVKKPSGAKPGFVVFTNNKTLYVTVKENLLQKLKQI